MWRILAILLRHSRIIVLGRELLWVIVRVVRVHVSIVHRRRRWVLLILVIRTSPPTHIWRHALPCRQMTAIHHAGLGRFSQTDRVMDRIGSCALQDEQRSSRTLLKHSTISASKLDLKMSRKISSNREMVDAVECKGPHEHVEVDVDYFPNYGKRKMTD